ncbi:hypothetical protein PR202_gb09978 [Eleusine coracana subsp. coracana]|uniref:Replication protein A 70 kDa DNA-binding subunit B/D first OB fold domain-containing protein n=1 Tax=Eleusine coracana subsp. coracana TaxID=191504 RepID=A0AAV5EGZ8_ELECO|nr:hypothetical protein PR202_gb09978 [Eleusine coracana subsp. coracana]
MLAVCPLWRFTCFRVVSFNPLHQRACPGRLSSRSLCALFGSVTQFGPIYIGFNSFARSMLVGPPPLCMNSGFPGCFRSPRSLAGANVLLCFALCVLPSYLHNDNFSFLSLDTVLIVDVAAWVLLNLPFAVVPPCFDLRCWFDLFLHVRGPSGPRTATAFQCLSTMPATRPGGTRSLHLRSSASSSQSALSVRAGCGSWLRSWPGAWAWTEPWCPSSSVVACFFLHFTSRAMWVHPTMAYFSVRYDALFAFDLAVLIRLRLKSDCDHGCYVTAGDHFCPLLPRSESSTNRSKGMQHVMLKTITPESHQWTVRTRVVRFCEYLSNDDPPRTLRIDLILLDEEGKAMKGQIPENWVDLFRPQLKEDNIYYIQYFQVRYARNIYQPVDHAYMMRFTAHTRVYEVTNVPDHFPLYAHAAAPFDVLRSRIGINEYCSDVIGVFTRCSHVKTQNTRGGPKLHRNVYITDGRWYVNPMLPEVAALQDRYRLSVIVMDPTPPAADENETTVELVFFGSTAEEIIGIPVAALIASQAGVGAFLPTRITSLYGKVFELRISVSPGSLQRVNITYQVDSVVRIPNLALPAADVTLPVPKSSGQPKEADTTTTSMNQQVSTVVLPEKQSESKKSADPGSAKLISHTEHSTKGDSSNVGTQKVASHGVHNLKRPLDELEDDNVQASTTTIERHARRKVDFGDSIDDE